MILYEVGNQGQRRTAAKNGAIRNRLVGIMPGADENALAQIKGVLLRARFECVLGTRQKNHLQLSSGFFLPMCQLARPLENELDVLSIR